LLSLAQSARRIGDLGNPLPDVYDPFKPFRITLRRAATSLIVAAPGVGKTALAIDWLRRLNVPALYVCIDTAEQDTTARAVSQITGRPLSEVEGDLSFFTEELTEYFGPIRWYFGGSPTHEEIENEVAAFGEAFGAFPEIVVVDNLTSIDMEGELNFASVRDTERLLNETAYDTGAHVMMLHHATGDYENGDKPIPLGGVEYKAGKPVDLCLTLTRRENEMHVSPVKNRGGIADATGRKHASLYVDLSRMKFYDQEPRDLPEE
jgi:hypothetical protein